MPCLDSLLTSTGSALTQKTLDVRNEPQQGFRFRSFLSKPDLYYERGGKTLEMLNRCLNQRTLSLAMLEIAYPIKGITTEKPDPPSDSEDDDDNIIKKPPPPPPVKSPPSKRNSKISSIKSPTETVKEPEKWIDYREFALMLQQ